MFSFCLGFVAMNAHSLAAFIGNDPQTDILVTVGCLLLVIGTVLRYRLPAMQQASSSHSHTLRVEPMQSNAYAATVGGLANTAGPQQHANVV